MSYKPFLIADMRVGKELDKEPFLLANDAFVELQNAYQWRGRVMKKHGHPLLARLQRNFTAKAMGNTAAGFTTSVNIFTIAPAITETEAMLRPGSISVSIGGNIITDATVYGTLSGAVGYGGTVNYATGALVLTHPNAVVAITCSFSYWPGLPVMGIAMRELDANNAEETVVWDTKYAYRYSNALASFEEAPSTLSTTWSGTNADFFWWANGFNALWATNCKAGLHGYEVVKFANAAGGPPITVEINTSVAHGMSVGDQMMFINCTSPADANNGLRGEVTALDPLDLTWAEIKNIDSTVTFPITWTDGATSGTMIVSTQNLHGDGIRWYNGTRWTNFNPVLNETTALMGAAMVFYYRDRLVCLDTLEGNSLALTNTRYPQRCRYSENGDMIFNTVPVPLGTAVAGDPNSWREDIPGRGGWIDAPTSENIVSAGFLKDTLIVFFERSTWRLRYTGNEVLPFIWERINFDLGSSAPHSTVLFDEGPVTVGQRGIIQTDGTGCQRMDQQLPDEVFSFHNQNSGPARIHGIRDFHKQLIYWCFPNDTQNETYPNRTLVYNYTDRCWGGPFKDSFTSFGTWQSFSDITWGTYTTEWGEASGPWNSQTGQALYPTIVGGNHQGFVNKVNSDLSSANGATLQIKSIAVGPPTVFRSKDHNLANGDMVRLNNCLGTGTFLNGTIFQVLVVDSDNIKLLQYVSGVFVPYNLGAVTYIGGGTLQRIDIPIIVTKKFNPSISEGYGTRVGFVEMYLDMQSGGEFIVNIYVDNNENTPVNPIESDNARSNVVEMFGNAYEMVGDKLWHALYNEAVGNMFQFEFTYSDAQSVDDMVSNSDFVIHAINIWADKASRRLS